jgi:hypothetical protein
MSQIIRLPGQLSTVLLRLLGMAITFLFTSFLYASGQAIQVTQVTVVKTGLAKTVRIDSTQPLYGIPACLIPHASYFFKGHIRSVADSQALREIKVSANGRISYTGQDGYFYLSNIDESPPITNWTFEATDTTELFEAKDTLISIPMDSLKHGDGLCFAGSDTVDLDLYLNKIPDKANAIDPKPVQMPLRIQQSNGMVRVCYNDGPLAQDKAFLALYNVHGRLVREVLDRVVGVGPHEVGIDASCLPAGIYFLKLRSVTRTAIAKIVLR